MAFVEDSQKTPRGVARRAECRTRETIEFAADDVAKGVAGKSVKSEKDNVHEHDERAEADAKFAVETEGFNNVVPEEAQKKNGEIKKVAVNVLKDEGKATLARIVLAVVGFADSAGGRIEKKGAVVSFAVVVARCAETQRPAENQNGGRELPPRERKQRRKKKGEGKCPYSKSSV